MRDVVLVPTFSRPEMLWHCLERLSDAEGIADYDLRILVDFHKDRNPPPVIDVQEVAKKFKHLAPKVIVREPHSFNGNSFNVLQGYKEVQDREHVLLVEDDVMVEADFFTWHRDMQAGGKAFCSVAVENQRSNLLRSDRDYASLGVCFPQSSIAEIVKHARSDYYKDQQVYISRNFNGRFGNEFHEQDGLILRIMGSVGGYSVWPLIARARHVGWYSYNRGYGERPKGTLQERYEQVKQRIRCS